MFNQDKYQDTTDGRNTWNINLYRGADAIRTVTVTIGETPVDFNTYDDVIQEVRTDTDNTLVLTRSITSGGITIDGQLDNRLHFHYPSTIDLKAGVYVHDIFFILNGNKEALLKRSRFTINQNVTEVSE